MSIIKSKGTKRVIASALASLAAILSFIPGTGQVLAIITAISSVLGGLGLGHAWLVETLGEKKLASVASAFAILVSVFQAVPQLQPYAEIVLVIAGALGIPAVAKNINDSVQN